MDHFQGQDGGRKKPYAPPVVTAVSLTPEEVALGACKASKNSKVSSKSANSQCRLCGSSYGS